MEKNNLVKIQTDTGIVELSNEIVRENLAVGDNITDSEIYNFIQLCIYRKLNPFLGQAHIIKYGKNSKAQLVTSKDVFITRMNNNPKCCGWNSGIIVLSEKKEIIERIGTFYLQDSEKLVGAWFKANIAGWKKESEHTINLSDYYRTYQKDGKNIPMGQWAKMPAVMLEKCVIVAGIRKTFPGEFGGMYSEDELGIDKGSIIETSYKVVEPESNLLGDKKNENKMKQLCCAAKSTIADYKPNDLLEYAMKQLVKNGHLESESKKEIPMSKFKPVLEYIQSLVKKREEQFIKKETESKEKTKESESDLPIINDFEQEGNKNGQ